MISKSCLTLIASVALTACLGNTVERFDGRSQASAKIATSGDTTGEDTGVDTGDLPTDVAQAVCGPNLYRFKSECLPEVQFKMAQESEDAANLEALAGAEGTKEQVDMQQQVIVDQVQQTEKYEKDLDEIAKTIKKQAKEGKLNLPPKLPGENKFNPKWDELPLQEQEQLKFQEGPAVAEMPFEAAPPG